MDIIASSSNSRIAVSTTGAPGLEFSLLDLITAVLRRKRVILLTTGITCVVAHAISFVVPASFTSTTKLMPPQQSESIASSILGQIGPLAGLAGKDITGRNQSELYVALLKSQTVEDALIQKFNLMSIYHKKLLEDARKNLGSRSDIVASKEGIISISVSDRDPNRAAALARGYVDELYKLNQTLAVSQAAQRRLFFEQQLEQEKENLSQAEVALAQTQQKSGLIQLDSQARATIEQNSRLEAELASTEVQLRAIGSFATQENPQYVTLKEQESALEAQLQKNTSIKGPGKYQIGTGTIPELGVEYLRRMRNLKYHEALYELLMRQTEAAKIDEAKSASIIQVIDKALVPERRASPRHSVYGLGGLLIGALFSIVWACTSEFLDKLNQDPEFGPRLLEIRKLLRFKAASSDCAPVTAKQ